MENEMMGNRRTITMTDGPGPGRGRKQCKNCLKYVGVKSKECPTCHSKFEMKSVDKDLISPSASSKKYKEEIKDPIRQYREKCLYTPADLCPIKLGEMTPSINNPKNAPISLEELNEWAGRLAALGLSKNVRYLPSALKYYLRHFYDMYSPLWKEAVGMLENWIVDNFPDSFSMERVNGT